MDRKGRIEHLRKGRLPAPGATYFVTAVTRDRKKSLANLVIFRSLLRSIESLQANQSATSLIWILMEDHLHGIFRLGDQNSLKKVMTTIKGPMTPHMRKANLSWQKNYFDHRIRPTESLASFLRYVLTNPYRANLVDITENWPFTYINHKEIEWFFQTTNKGRPYLEWIKQKYPGMD